jgi:anti-sigma-K factor RskA
VSSGLEHRECAEGLGAYALGALPDAEAVRVREHLSECRECRAALDWLRAGVDVLPASVPPVEPPPELKTRLMAIVEAEAELLRAAGENADKPRAARRRRRRPAGIGLRVAVGFAALCAVVVAVLAITLGGTATKTILAQIHDPTLAGAQASLQIHGTRAELVVRKLPVLAPGYVDELWVKRGSAPPVPAGTFALVSGSVVVAHSVRPGDLVMVTVEPGRGTATPTTAPVIVARA